MNGSLDSFIYSSTSGQIGRKSENLFPPVPPPLQQPQKQHSSLPNIHRHHATHSDPTASSPPISLSGNLKVLGLPGVVVPDTSGQLPSSKFTKADASRSQYETFSGVVKSRSEHSQKNLNSLEWGVV